MGPDRERRTYDLLRLVGAEEPIGSIRLVDRMQRLGYSIRGRTIRLLLSDLDEEGLTEKVPGRGRRLTERGRSELNRGDVSGRYGQRRERIASLRSRVTYDPTTHAGDVVVSRARVPDESLRPALDALSSLSETPLGPVTAAVERDADGTTFRFPSSITLDGVLLSSGIDATLRTAGLVEYRPGDAEPVARYVDLISGEGSTLDVVNLLVEAGRTDVAPVLAGEPGVLIVDSREFPLDRYEAAEDLVSSARERLGGVVDLRRPREAGPFPLGGPGRNVATLTYGGAGELALGLLAERSLAVEWRSLDGLRPAADLSTPADVSARLGVQRDGASRASGEGRDE